MKNNIQWLDSHVHLNMGAFLSDQKAVIDRAKQAHVTAMIHVALGPETINWQSAQDLAANHEGVFLAGGIHPHDAKDVTTQGLDALGTFLNQGNVVAFGEIGLDFFHNHSPKERQLEIFETLLDMALDIKKPVIIHARDAFDELFEITARINVFSKVGGVLHCFSGDQSQAKRFIDLGAYISFAGNLTFKKAVVIQEAARWVPLDRMLIETDCPFLAPDPHRGKRNEPALVTYVGEALAKIRGLTPQDIALHTRQNAINLFQLPL